MKLLRCSGSSYGRVRLLGHSLFVVFLPVAIMITTVSCNSGNDNNPVNGSEEIISTPNSPSGPNSGFVGHALTYTTRGANSNLGHSLEYRFDWGDGNYSNWSSSTSASHSWSSTGTKYIQAQARCGTHTSKVSNWSSSKSVVISEQTETISTPNQPTGPDSGQVNENLSYTTGGANSNLGHSLQYRFDWGDGNYSNWSSSTSASHSWSTTGTKYIQAQARCATHTSTVSAWSSYKTVVIYQPELLLFTDGFRPHLSPDTTKVVFTRLLPSSSPQDEQSDIWLVNIDGSHPRPLTDTPSECEYSPQWHPNGERIAFLRSPSANYYTKDPGDLWDMEFNGTDQTQRTEFSMMTDFCLYVRSEDAYVVAVFDDGSLWLSIAPWPDISGFALRRYGGLNPRSPYNSSSPAPEIVINDNTNRKIILFNPVHLNESYVASSWDFPEPCLSPSGNKIAAGCDGGLPYGLYVMDIDGSNRHQLTSDKDYSPSWSRSTIVFVRVGPDFDIVHGHIYKITGVSE